MSQRVADIRIDPAMIESFGRTMRQKLTSGSVPFRKAYLRALVDISEVDDAHIRIKGCKDVLERAVLARRAGMSLCWRGDKVACTGSDPRVIEGNPLTMRTTRQGTGVPRCTDHVLETVAGGVPAHIALSSHCRLSIERRAICHANDVSPLDYIANDLKSKGG